MKGLEAYLKKYGKHFTEKLAMSITEGRWNGTKVRKAAQKKVYYNVIGFTIGDMVYLTNVTSTEWKYPSIGKSINYTLYVMGDYSFNDGVLFDKWLDDMVDEGEVFDFTPYI